MLLQGLKLFKEYKRLEIQSMHLIYNLLALCHEVFLAQGKVHDFFVCHLDALHGGYGFFVPNLNLTKVFISENPPPPANFNILDRFPTIWDLLYVPIQLPHLEIETFCCHSLGCDFLGESQADLWQHIAVTHCKQAAACPYCLQYLCFEEVPTFTHPGLFC